MRTTGKGDKGPEKSRNGLECLSWILMNFAYRDRGKDCTEGYGLGDPPRRSAAECLEGGTKLLPCARHSVPKMEMFSAPMISQARERETGNEQKAKKTITIYN